MEKDRTSVAAVALIFFLAGGLMAGNQEYSKPGLEKTEGLRKEIRLLNLINGLELNQDQMEIILASARESKRSREEFESTLFLRKEEMEAALEEIRSYLNENRELPPSTIQNYHRLDREMREIRAQVEERIKGLAQNIEECLDPHQLHQLQEFVPCIIPPKGEKRIGQARDNKGLTRSLERIRRIPESMYRTRKEEIVWRSLEGLKLHAPPFTDIDEEEMTRHIESIYDEARSLEGVEFEIQKERLAEKMISPFRPNVPSANLTRKIWNFLLAPEVIPILEERIERGGPASNQRKLL